MTFEEAMKAELTAVTAISQKIHPIVAPEGSKGPFLTYRRLYQKYRKCLNGVTKSGEASYELVLESNSYLQLVSVSLEIESIVNSFFGRYIGTDGPLIQDCTIEGGEDVYDLTTNLMARTMRLTVNHQ